MQSDVLLLTRIYLVMIVRNYLSRSTPLNGRYIGSTEARLQLHFFGIHIYIYT